MIQDPDPEDAKTNWLWEVALTSTHTPYTMCKHVYVQINKYNLKKHTEHRSETNCESCNI